MTLRCDTCHQAAGAVNEVSMQYVCLNPTCDHFGEQRTASSSFDDAALREARRRAVMVRWGRQKRSLRRNV